ncbi:hypothetical protein [Candidatus Nitrospira salsa]
MIQRTKLRLHYFGIVVAIIVLSCLIPEGLLAQSRMQVDIIEPSSDGQEVGIRTNIKGTAIMPEDNFLWILVHRIRDFEDLWWPQGEVMVNAKSSTWIKNVRFGEERDIGYQFEIAVITVAKTEHELLNRFIFLVKQTGQSNPIKMPSTTSPPKYRIVKKVRH